MTEFQYLNSNDSLELVKACSFNLDDIAFAGDKLNFWDHLSKDLNFLGFPRERIFIFDYSKRISHEKLVGTYHEGIYSHRFHYCSRGKDDPEKYTTVMSDNGFAFTMLYDGGCIFLGDRKVRKYRGKINIDPETYFILIHEIVHWLYAKTLKDVNGIRPENMVNYGLSENAHTNVGIFSKHNTDIENHVCDLSFYIMCKLGLITKFKKDSVFCNALLDLDLSIFVNENPDTVFKQGEILFKKLKMDRFLNLEV